jgi:hypothetical protein
MILMPTSQYVAPQALSDLALLPAPGPTIQILRSNCQTPPSAAAPPSEYGCGQRDEPRCGGCARTDCPIGPRALAARALGARALATIQPMPESLLPRHLLITSPPPAKRTRKAMKRRCEAELLRDEGEDGNLLLSPLRHLPPPPVLSPLSTPSSPPTPRMPPPPSPPEPRPSTPIRTTPVPPSPTAAPADLLTPPPIAVSPPPDAVDEYAELVQCMVTTDGPPPPPPWTESYVFSDDPDRIVCRKCCNRHYNYRWYNHCFMCHVR